MSDASGPSQTPAPAPAPGLVDALTAKLRRFGGLKSVILAGRRVRERAIERWLGIDTVSPPGKRFDLGTHFADPVPYEPVDYVLLRRYTRPIRLRPDDVVVDIGCGMGRMLCLFARRRVRKVIGIEFSRELAEIARQNAATVRGRRAEIEVRQGDACEADYSDATVIWMFNPFGPATMRTVMERLGRSLEAKPRTIQIAYVNPLHEDILAATGWLRRTGREQSLFFRTYGASYWSNAPAAGPEAGSRSRS